MNHPTTTNAHRRSRGLRRVAVWLPVEVVAHLDAICESSGYSRAEILETLILCDYESLVEARGTGVRD